LPVAESPQIPRRIGRGIVTGQRTERGAVQQLKSGG
jgi:hypothetical protein